MKSEIKFSKHTIDEIEICGGNDSKIDIVIGKNDQQKINKWLLDIRGNGEGIDTMHFPQLTYTVDATGDIGIIMIITEGITGKRLDLTDISKW